MHGSPSQLDPPFSRRKMPTRFHQWFSMFSISALLLLHFATVLLHAHSRNIGLFKMTLHDTMCQAHLESLLQVHDKMKDTISYLQAPSAILETSSNNPRVSHLYFLKYAATFLHASVLMQQKEEFFQSLHAFLKVVRQCSPGYHARVKEASLRFISWNQGGMRKDPSHSYHISLHLYSDQLRQWPTLNLAHVFQTYASELKYLQSALDQFLKFRILVLHLHRGLCKVRHSATVSWQMLFDYFEDYLVVHLPRYDHARTSILEKADPKFPVETAFMESLVATLEHLLYTLCHEYGMTSFDKVQNESAKCQRLASVYTKLPKGPQLKFKSFILSRRLKKCQEFNERGLFSLDESPSSSPHENTTEPVNR